jgi:ribosomal protein L12E/L44/L45/RPP1/RPP2
MNPTMRALTRAKAVLESVGIDTDSDRLDKLVSELEGKDINQVRWIMQKDFGQN